MKNLILSLVLFTATAFAVDFDTQKDVKLQMLNAKSTILTNTITCVEDSNSTEALESCMEKRKAALETLRKEEKPFIRKPYYLEKLQDRNASAEVIACVTNANNATELKACKELQKSEKFDARKAKYLEKLQDRNASAEVIACVNNASDATELKACKTQQGNERFAMKKAALIEKLENKNNIDPEYIACVKNAQNLAELKVCKQTYKKSK